MFPESFEETSPLPNLTESVPTPTTPVDEAEAGVADHHRDLEYLEEIRNIHSFVDDDESNTTKKIPSNKNKAEPAINDQQVKDLLSNGEADALLKIYRTMCATFPFVPIDDFASAAELHSAKPMLFLAVMTAASWDNHKLQRHLDRVYRKEIAEHTFIRPRRTLALLQSVLVYLSRYAFRN